jgi:hypothetical protein
MPVEQPSPGPAAPQDVHCVLHDGIVTFVSSATTLASGFPPEHFHGMHVSQVVHPDDLMQLDRYLAPGWTGEIRATFRVLGIKGRWNWRFAQGVRTADSTAHYNAVIVLREVDPPSVSTGGMTE